MLYVHLLPRLMVGAPLRNSFGNSPREVLSAFSRHICCAFVNANGERVVVEPDSAEHRTIAATQLRPLTLGSARRG